MALDQPGSRAWRKPSVFASTASRRAFKEEDKRMTTVVISGTTAATEAIAEGLRRQGVDVVLIEDPRVLRALELLIEAASGPDGARLSRLPARVRPAEAGVAGDPCTRPGSPTALAEYEPGAQFADWRNDVLSLTSTPGAI